MRSNQGSKSAQRHAVDASIRSGRAFVVYDTIIGGWRILVPSIKTGTGMWFASLRAVDHYVSSRGGVLHQALPGDGLLRITPQSEEQWARVQSEARERLMGGWARNVAASASANETRKVAVS